MLAIPFVYYIIVSLKLYDSIPFPDHEIVACFRARKPVPFLKNHIFELEDNIFGEIPVPFVKVFNPVSRFIYSLISHVFGRLI